MKQSTIKRIDRMTYDLLPKNYLLLKGDTEGAPTCPYGNNYKWIGYNRSEKQFVRFTKSVFRDLIKKRKL